MVGDIPERVKTEVEEIVGDIPERVNIKVEETVGESNPVVESLGKILERVKSICSQSCICRVPQPLRSVNPKAYTPKVISIGPLHHNTPDLMANTHKSRYLQNFLLCTNLSLRDVFQLVEPLVQRVRDYYAEPIDMIEDDFVRLLILDGCFVVMYIIGSQFPEFRDEDTSFLWRFGNGIFCDLILLENQLPFFLLDALYDLCASSKKFLPTLNFAKLASQYFCDANEGNCLGIVGENDEVIQNHFVDHLRTNLIRSCSPKPEPNVSTSCSFRHSIWPPTVTELHNCGVSFKMKSENNMDIEFIDGDNILKLPQIIVSETSEIQLRNLMAYEQCHGSRLTRSTNNNVCNFAFFLSYLINTKKDVGLLINDGIIQNNLGSIEEVTSFFNNLCKQLPVPRNLYHNECEMLKNHCKERKHRWMTSLRRDYFNTPWAFFPFFFAILLFVLTMLQAVMAFLALQREILK